MYIYLQVGNTTSPHIGRTPIKQVCLDSGVLVLKKQRGFHLNQTGTFPSPIFDALLCQPPLKVGLQSLFNWLQVSRLLREVGSLSSDLITG